MFNSSRCSGESLCFSQCSAGVYMFAQIPCKHVSCYFNSKSETDVIRFGIESLVIDIHVQTSRFNLDN